MASTSAAGKETWHTGDTCMALDPRDGTLREATIQRLTTSPNGDTIAGVVFTNCVEDEEEEEEEDVPVSKLQRPGLNHFTQEKPVFPSVVTDPQQHVALKLSDTYGHRVPYTINRYLRDYQREGIRFLYSNYMRYRGCILGDDMGLGKTVQVIGFLAAVLHKTGTWEDVQNNRPQFLQSQMPCKQSKPNKVFLIVAPLSVLYNWKDELETWGHFQCVVVHGLRKEEELARINKGRVEIALTTYETLRLCLDQFNNIEWSAVIVDEAHKIKNPSSQVTQAMKDLNCKVRMGLTGTILQNNLEELWCVMDWAIPGCLGNLGHFKNHFCGPIEKGHKHSATKRALATGRKAVRALVRKISHWFLRRTKALIQEQLPKKDDRVVFCSLTDFQQTVYQTVLDTEDVTLLLRASEKCDCGSRRTRRGCCYKTNSEGVEMKNLYFSYLAILRKVTNHVALLQSTAGTSKKQEKYVRGICSKVFQKFPDFAQRCKDEAFEALSDPMYSGKMKVLQKLIRFYLQKKDKVLLFSLSTKLLDVLESYCMAEGLDYSRLDGNTKAKERVQIVKNFNSRPDANLCLVSTMAGGVGLNFVGANVVVLFDPTWNPANDLQAIDRAYRIGQCRDVTVLRLISLGTVEEIIYLRQVYKQQLQSSVMGKESARRYFEAVQGHGVHKGELFGIKNLFRLQTQGTCLTHQILEREGRVESGVMTASTHTAGEKQQEEEEEEEEEKRGVSEPGAPKMPKGVLDFSSGSEDDEEEGRLKRKTTAASSDPARMTLLQHGFSRLLEKLEGKPEAEENSSTCVEESVSEEDAGDQRKTSSAEKTRSCLPGSGTEARDVPGGSHRKSEENGEGRSHERLSLVRHSDNLGRGSPGLKGRTNMKITVDEESGDSSSPEIKNPNKSKAAALKVQRFGGFSDESEDLELDVSHSHDKGKGRADRSRKRQSASSRDKARSKYSEDIETFTSSEDELIPVKKGRPAAGTSRAVSFTNVKNQTSPTSRRNQRTIDSVLGGVREVCYTHSNQRVVGGSKAEELISRAAVRDVFELKMYSQMPANHLMGSIESLPESPPESQPLSPPARAEPPRAQHPVTFSQRSVHHTRHATFTIGETPQAIRRQQLEEMAAMLNFPSVLEFAAEILRRSSSQRIAWLQQYYTSLDQPDLADTVTNNFPPPESAEASSSSTTRTRTDTKTPQKRPPAKKKSKSTQNKPARKTKPQTPQNNGSVPESPQSDVREPRQKLKISDENVLEPQSDDPSLESEEQEETARAARRHKRTKRASVSASGGHGAGGGLGLDGAGSSGLGSGEVAAGLNRTHRDGPSSADPGPGRSATLSKPTARGREQEQEPSPRPGRSVQGQGESGPSPLPPPSTSGRSFLSDLIGDTSILDDLLKPKTRGSPKTSIHTPPRITAVDSHQKPDTPRTPKAGRRDFWDILNEGNEESINKLTDPAEVQRVCIKSDFAAKRRSGEEESRSLWKTNEKFLWKK